MMSPAKYTASPSEKPRTSGPTAATTPAPSQPMTWGGWGTGVPAGAPRPLRTLVSTGFTETALTCTSRSRGPGAGRGNVAKCNTSGPPYTSCTMACIVSRPALMRVPLSFFRSRCPAL